MESEDEYDRNYREKHNRNKFRGERQGDGSYSIRCREYRRSRDWQYTEKPASQHYSTRSADRDEYCPRRGKRQREADDESLENRKKGPRSPPESPKRIKQSDEPVMEELHPVGQNFIRPGPRINPSFYGSVMASNFPAPNRFNVPPFQFHPMHQWPAGPRPEIVNRLLNFKAYMASQDDDITEEEAQKRYAMYKEGFLRMQVQEFFQEHQSEEWFRQRYHPSELVKVQSEKTEAVKERLAIFMQYQQAIGIDELVLDSTETVKLTKFLDDIVVLLEGGSVEDILKPVVKNVTNSVATDESIEEKKKTGSPEKENSVKVDNSNEDIFETISFEEVCAPIGNKDSKIEFESNSKPGEQAIVNNDKKAGEILPKAGAGVNQANTLEGTIAPEARKYLDGISDSSASSGDERRLNDLVLQGLHIIAQTLAEESKNPKPIEGDPVPESKPLAIPTAKPRSNLLNLNSIFIRALPPTFTKQEVEAMCRQHEGFIRLALADPTAERNWLRRAWATYESTVNLSSIVYRMNVLKPRGYSLSVMVNRKLSNRIRFGSPLSTQSRSIRTDMRLAAQLVYSLDRKHRLWTSDDGDGEGQTEEQSWMLGILTSKNPLLANVMDFFTEEASAEEDELLGSKNGTDPSEVISETSLRELTRFMDRLLIYLRVVHSVDFYQRCEYVNEHYMPNRCGIMHVRGLSETVPPSAAEVEIYCKETVNVIAKVFLDPPPEVSLAEQRKLGVKDKSIEIEKLVDAVTKKISEEKVQCEVCYKKFRSTLFVRKHIEAKHSEKLDEVVINVEFFNNYLRDAKRPKPWDPSSPSMEKMTRRDAMPLYNPMLAAQRFNGRANFRPGGHSFGPYGPYPMSGMQRGARYPNYRYPMPGPGVMDHYGRPIITYRDLDAPPQDDDMFL